MCTHGQTLHTLTKVTKGSTLLLFITFVAFLYSVNVMIISNVQYFCHTYIISTRTYHYRVARKFCQIYLFLSSSDFFLPKLLFLGFLSLTSFLFRHFILLMRCVLNLSACVIGETCKSHDCKRGYGVTVLHTHRYKI